MLQVFRLCTRTRTLLVCHPPPLSSSSRRRGLPIPGLQNRLGEIKEELRRPFLIRHFSAANACRKPPFRSLYRLHSTSVDHVGTAGKTLGQFLGLFVGISYLSGRQGLANIANCENDQDHRWPSSSEVIRNHQPSRVRRVVKKLWVPSLCVLTISLGWHYPLSLILNLLFLMWTTKPSPSSIYVWVEQIRQENILNATGIDRVKAQAAGVMHVEVRDNMLFCLARVTSLTKRSTLLGFLGDWWVIYSSSSAIHYGVKLRNLIPTVNPFNRE
ncbi:unnamed protein product [Calypogeia fissa]